MSDNYLPSEIVLEILHRLPVKSLVKFTSVCRAWNSLITDRTFISDHLSRTLIQASNGHKGSLFFQFCLGRNLRWHEPPREYAYSLYSTTNQQTDHHFSVQRFPLPCLSFQPDHCAWFGGACNGLVSSAHHSRSSGSVTFLIWNPLLRKYVVLPKPLMTRNRDVYIRYFGLGFDSRNNDYKVVVLMQTHSGQENDHLEVYSLVSRSWRSVAISVPKFFLDVEFRSLPLFVNGAMHWVIHRMKDGSIQRSILSFDVTEETFGELTLPLQSNEKSNISTTLLVVEGGGRLAVVNHPRKGTGCFLHIWVMKEYGVTDSWTEILHLPCGARRCTGRRLDVLALTSNGKGIMRRLDGGAIVLVDPTKKSMELMGQKADAAYTGCYVESLFFINKEFDALSF
ncbi:hypothetical protein QN277_023500 [Acacia crassicarpa]|uniref:F-box domain-containing protein n=1 Tax=Acacia crassicarpa TaxID=499986 RepID=A0AAE1JHB1_9FABA|nr:hypothetical protein QN277_023500 [Acacia crassicarpa]